MPRSNKAVDTRRRSNSPTVKSTRGLELVEVPESVRPGATLMNLILTRAIDLGLRDVDEVAQRSLGCTAAYFYSLKNGNRPVHQLGSEQIAAAARFLNMPVVSVMLAAGKIKLADFYTDPSQVEVQMRPALLTIQADPKFAPLFPTGILDASAAIKQFVIVLYETATGRSLIPGRRTAEEIASMHNRLEKGAS